VLDGDKVIMMDKSSNIGYSKIVGVKNGEKMDILEC